MLNSQHWYSEKKREDEVQQACFLGTHPRATAMAKVIAGIKFVMVVASDDVPNCSPW
jgi:hypothetical protein